MARTEPSLRLQRLKSSTDWLWRIHFPSIRTNGCISPSIAGACSIAMSGRRKVPSPIKGNYAKQLSSDPVEGFAFFEESIELSRRFRALKVWLSLRYHGLHAFRAAIQQDLDHAQRLAAAIEDSASLELLGPVELSAVCFRHLLGKDASRSF